MKPHSDRLCPLVHSQMCLTDLLRSLNLKRSCAKVLKSYLSNKFSWKNYHCLVSIDGKTGNISPASSRSPRSRISRSRLMRVPISLLSLTSTSPASTFYSNTESHKLPKGIKWLKHKISKESFSVEFESSHQRVSFCN